MALRALVGAENVKNGIVFCNRKSEVDVVAKSLKTHGFNAAAIHGDLDQPTRMRTLAAFRDGELRLLVASDVAARGLDIPDVSHIFNYDVPHHADDYVHRIGRTGRAGKSGQAFMIVTPADTRSLDKVIRLIELKPDEVTLDLDWSQAKSRPRPERGRDSRRPGRERERPPRDHSRPHRESRRHEQAATVPAPAPVPVPVASPASPPPVASAAATPVAAPESKPAREHRRPEPEARPRRDEREDRGVRGFGDDTPAFLLRGAPRGE